MSKLVVRNLYKVFGFNPKLGVRLIKEGKGKDEILKETGMTVGMSDVNFEVHEGETFVIMGLSGSGKSTVIRCLNRLIKPTAGQVILDGQDLTSMKKRQLIEVRRTAMSMVFQNFALLPNRTVLANTEYGLEVQKISPAKRKEKALEALALVGLEGYEDSYPDQLSGGMKQRVGLARALANDPEVLLMDEAFSALDPLIRSDMQDELIDLQHKMKKTIIFITHDLDEAIKLGDRIMLMKDGKVIQIGKPEEILANPADEYVERFVQSVDRSGLLTAADIMSKPWTTANINKNPLVALSECKKYGLENILVTKEGRILCGAVSASALQQAVHEGKPTLHGITKEDEVERIAPDTNIKQIIESTLQSSVPVAVVDDTGKLMGVIIKSSILRTMIPGRGNGHDDT
ncbi:MAG: glycine betaine/L-proline ABC transporter ATP-binding protein [Oscillospiraceae bacterium]|nr:glycine betaine/L-proline ABC transporter ATP-binding protein [Oscillospiraceae bacterium]